MYNATNIGFVLSSDAPKAPVVAAPAPAPVAVVPAEVMNYLAGLEDDLYRAMVYAAMLEKKVLADEAAAEGREFYLN